MEKIIEKQIPKFYNRPNELIRATYGKQYWISRAPAVVAVVLVIWKDNIFVLAEQRSEKMDNPGKWCCPCGYLDWDETGYQAVIREIYEEAGIFIPDYVLNLITNNEEQPFFVQTHPSENRQNVALTYCIILDCEKLGLPEFNKDDGEVTNIGWIPIEQVFNKKYEWAFNHDERIQMAVEKFKSYLI